MAAPDSSASLSFCQEAQKADSGPGSSHSRNRCEKISASMLPEPCTVVGTASRTGQRLAVVGIAIGSGAVGERSLEFGETRKLAADCTRAGQLVIKLKMGLLLCDILHRVDIWATIVNKQSSSTYHIISYYQA